MKLQSIENWAKEHFVPGSEPDLQRVRRLLREGELPGRKVGGKWYVDLDGFESEPLDDTDPVVNELLAKIA